MFDTQCIFRIQIPALASNFPALLYAVLAISARQMERKEGIQDSFESLELYQEAIWILSPLLQVRDPKVIAACVLLCCLEMMSARAQDWRRHLEGCAALFDAFGIHGFSDGLLQAVFWCYARMGMEEPFWWTNESNHDRSMRCVDFRWHSEYAFETIQMVSTWLA